MMVTLAPRFYDSGVKARGDRTIMVDGVRWGYVEMKGHGCHGPSYEFHDVHGAGIHVVFNSGRISVHQLESVHMPRKWDRNADPRDIEQRIIDKTRELIDAGKLRDPGVIAAENAAASARYRAAQAADDVERDQMREALKSLWRRPDLTNAERAGLSAAYKDIFTTALERAIFDEEKAI